MEANDAARPPSRTKVRFGAKPEAADHRHELPLSAGSGHSRDLDWSAQLDPEQPFQVRPSHRLDPS